MRNLQFIFFFGIVFSLHFLINLYIFTKGLRSFESGSQLRLCYSIGFWTLALSYFAGRLLEKLYLSYLSDLLTWIGSFWLAAMLYLFLIVLFIDVLRLINHFVPFFHHLGIFTQKPYLLTIGIAVFVFLLLLGGHINSIYPRVRTIELQKQITDANPKEIKIVLATDIHLGTIISTKRVRRIVELINKQQADLVLFAGDIVDEDLAPVIRQNLGAILGEIKPALGVYGITGNHEYIGGADAAVEYLSEHGIIMLQDEMLQITDQIVVAGRNDLSSNRFNAEKRKPLTEILANVSNNQFVIVMDHQPSKIFEAVDAGADLVLSGHTHHGQLWPLNYITQAMFSVSWGLKRFENTTAYVSSGVGSWGPPVRIGNKPEIVLFTLKFEN